MSYRQPCGRQRRDDFNRGVIEEFRANDGKTTGPFAQAPLMLPTTTGAKSGKERITPMPGFAQYETKTDRIIPIVVLERI